MSIKNKITGRRIGRLILAVLAGTFLISGCGKKHEKIDLSSIHTTAAVSETMAPKDAADSATEDAVTKPDTDSTPAAATEGSTSSTGKKGGSAAAANNISTKLNTYESGNLSIQYPSVVNMDDSDKAAVIDKLMKDNALSIVGAYGLDASKDSLEITCKVLSADRNRITAVYTGLLSGKDAAYPVNVFYSNTVDINHGTNMGFQKFADPYTMAGYVLSNDCEFYGASPELTAELTKIKNESTIEEYTNLFSHADFPINGDFPGSFSYENEGTIFFSIPVPHALGDYAIVKYTPETK